MVGEEREFKTSDTELRKYNGQLVVVLKQLTDDEVDIADVGNMYKIKFSDGYTRDAFENELF